jgi:hypothetical protein
MTTELPTGCIRGLDIAEYHAANALSVSKIKVFRYSPALFFGRFIAKTIAPPEETQAFFDGKAIETLGLDGRAEWQAKYAVTPADAPARPTEAMLNAAKPSAKSIARQEYWAHWDAANAGKISISSEGSEMVERINANLHAHPLAGPLLAACEKQVTFRLQGEHFPIPIQVRPDAWCEEGCEVSKGEPAIVDLKTLPKLPDDDPEVISRQIAAFWYAGQAFIYREIVATVLGWPKDIRPRFIFIFAEKEAPFRIKLAELDDVSLDVAFKQATETLDRMKQCFRTGIWPNTWDDTFTKEVPKVSLPKYYIRRETEDDGHLFG